MTLSGDFMLLASAALLNDGARMSIITQRVSHIIAELLSFCEALQNVVIARH